MAGSPELDRRELDLLRELDADNLTDRRDLDIERELAVIEKERSTPNEPPAILSRNIEAAAQGFIQTFIDTLKGPAELSAEIGFSPFDTPPDVAFNQVFFRLGLGDVAFTPENKSERAFSQGGKLAGIGTQLLTGAQGAVNKLALTGVKQAKTGGQVLKNIFLEPLVTGPGRNAALEIGGSFAAGATGQVIAEEFGEENRFTGELVGGISAGVVIPGLSLLTPATVLGRAINVLAIRPVQAIRAQIRKTPNARVNRMSELTAANKLENQAADIIHTSFKIDNYNSTTFADIPGFQPRTDQLANDRGLNALTKQFAREDASFNVAVNEVDTANNQLIRDTLDEVSGFRLPASPERPGILSADAVTVRFEIENSTNKLLNNLNKRLELAEEIGLARIRNVSGKDADLSSLSIVMKQEIAQAFESFTSQKKLLWDAVDPSNTARFPTSRLKKQVKLNEGLLKADRPISGEEEAIYNVIKGFGGGESFGELRALRTRIQTEIKAEGGRGPGSNKKKMARLSKSLKSTQDLLDDINLFSKDATVVDRYKIARDYTSEGNIIFKTRQMARITSRGPLGELSRTSDSATLQTLIKGGGKGALEAAMQLKQAIGSQGDTIVNKYMVRLAWNFSTNVDGIVDPAKLSKFIDNYSDVFKVFPGAKKGLNNVIEAENSIRALRGDLKRTKTMIEEASATLFLKNKPRDVIGKILSSANPEREMNNIMRSLKGNADAVNGLRRAFWDNFLNTVETGVKDLTGAPYFSPKRMRIFIDENEGVLRRLGYNKPHIRILRQMADASEVISRNPIGPNVDVKADPTVLVPVRTLISRAWATARTIVSPGFAAATLGLETASKVTANLTNQQVRALLERAMIDPRVAQRLIAKVTQFNQKSYVKFIGVTLAEIGLPISGFQMDTSLEELPEEEPKKKRKPFF